MDISVVSVQVCYRLEIVITPCNIRLEDFTLVSSPNLQGSIKAWQVEKPNYVLQHIS